MANYIAFQLTEDEMFILRRLKKLMKSVGKHEMGYVTAGKHEMCAHEISAEDLFENLSCANKWRRVMERLTPHIVVHDPKVDTYRFHIGVDRIKFGVTFG